MIYCESCGYSEDKGLWNLKLWCKKWKISVYPEDMDCGSGVEKDDNNSRLENIKTGI